MAELQAVGELRAGGELPGGEAQCEAQNCTVAEYIKLMNAAHNMLIHGMMAAVHGDHPGGHGGRGQRGSVRGGRCGGRAERGCRKGKNSFLRHPGDCPRIMEKSICVSSQKGDCISGPQMGNIIVEEIRKKVVEGSAKLLVADETLEITENEADCESSQDGEYISGPQFAHSTVKQETVEIVVEESTKQSTG